MEDTRPPIPPKGSNEYRAYSSTGLEARAIADWKGMVSTGDSLERIGCYAEAWELFADACIIRKPPLLPEWMGEDLPDATLFVERRMRRTGAELRMARFLGLANTRFHKVIGSVESRLVGLFSRSFPEVSITCNTDSTVSDEAAYGASYERLAQFFGGDAQSIIESFRPLLPPENVLAEIVRRRAAGDRPVIGIAWHSTNQRKHLPGLRDWAGFLGSMDAHWVSLQYDDIASGLQTLAELSDQAIEGANGIDQIADLDGFAAQVASVDRVVTISNTTAHMAGALGVPCLVLLDNLQQLIWPTGQTTTPFYPETRLIRLGNRQWADVLGGLAEVLDLTSKRLRSQNV